MDKAEQIIQEIYRIAQDLGVDDVELDRRYPIKRDDAPLIVVDSGEEESAARESDPKHIWHRRWVMRPVIRVYLDIRDQDQQRAELNRIWMEFLMKFKESDLGNGRDQLLSANTMPAIAKELTLPHEYAAIAGMEISLELQFDRR